MQKAHTHSYILCFPYIDFWADANWGSSRQAQTYVAALKCTLDLQTVEEHVKNYRPQILVLSGLPSARPPLVDFGQIITKNNALLVCGNIIQVNVHLWLSVYW